MMRSTCAALLSVVFLALIANVGAEAGNKLCPGCMDAYPDPPYNQDPWADPMPAILNPNTLPLLTLLSNKSDAKCMDGSPAGYYLDKAPTSAAENRTKWVFNMDAGQQCAEQSQCAGLYGLGKGSSKVFTPYCPKNCYLASRNYVEAGYVYNWNRLHVPYCSGDIWTGTLKEPSSTTGMYHSGHLILMEVVAHLVNTTNFAEATEIVLTGVSAGAMSAWIHANLFQKLFPKARVTIASFSGFADLTYPYEGPYAAPKGYPAYVGGQGDTWIPWADFNEASYNVWQSYVDEDCKKSFPGTPWLCFLANYNRPTVKAAAFVIQPETDAEMILGRCRVPPPPWGKVGAAQGSTYQNEGTVEIRDYLAAFSENMTNNVRNRLRPEDGYFMPACWITTEYDEWPWGPAIMDRHVMTMYTSYHAWWEWHYKLGKPGSIPGLRLAESCGFACGACSYSNEAPSGGAPVVLAQKPTVKTPIAQEPALLLM